MVANLFCVSKKLSQIEAIKLISNILQHQIYVLQTDTTEVSSGFQILTQAKSFFCTSINILFSNITIKMFYHRPMNSYIPQVLWYHLMATNITKFMKT